MKTANKIALGAIAAVSALYGGIAPVSLPGLFGVEDVSATEPLNTTKHNLAIRNSFTGLDITEKADEYDYTNHIHNIYATITANEQTLRQILTQIPGKDGSLYAFYFDIAMDSSFGPYFEKSGDWYDNSITDVAAQMHKAESQLTATGLDQYLTAWTQGFMITFKWTDGNWYVSGDKGDGVNRVSIGDNLRKWFNKAGRAELSDDELIASYGENWRISMVTDQTNMMVWARKNSDGTDAGYKEYARVYRTLEFPVAAKIANSDVYYPTVQQALGTEATEIVVNKAITTSDDIIVPAGKKLIVAAGGSLTLKDGAKIIAAEATDDLPAGEVEAPTSQITYINNVVIATTVNGETILPGETKANITAGQTVTLDVEDKFGYTYEVRFTNSDGKPLAIDLSEDFTFTMPNQSVNVEIAYTAIPVNFIAGENVIYNASTSEEGLTFKLDGDFSLFDKVYLDGELVDSANYTAASGSTIITLKQAYLAGLTNGKHTVKVTYTNGAAAETTFTLRGAKAPNTGAATIGSGSASAFLTATIIGMTTSIVAFGIALIKRRHNA